MRSESRSHWRAFVGRVAVALVVVSCLSAGGVGGAYWVANNKVDNIRNAKIREGVLDPVVGKGSPANFLIVGSDTRSFVDGQKDTDAFGNAATVSGQRSDTIMIAHVDPDTGTGLLVSIPRDLWVDIPGMGKAKINAAFNEGPAKVIETIQTNFDIPIHHYLEVDFAGFKGIVDAIGSVPIFFPTPARDEKTGLDIKWGGCTSLSGDQALAYVRSRFYEYYDVAKAEWRSDPTSDLGRIRRQQYFMRSIAKAAIDKGGRNPIKAYRLLGEVVRHLVKDPGLGLSDLKALMNTFRNVDPAVVEMTTVPWTADRISGQDVLLLKTDEAQPLFERLRTFGKPPADKPPPANLKPAQVQVQVQNGSGVRGAAGEALAALKALDFAGMDPATDADRVDYAVTEIRYGPDSEGAARLVKKYLAGAGRLVALDSAASGAEVVLVIGRDFTGVYAPGTAPTTTAAATTSTTGTTVPANPGSTPGVTAPYDPSSGRPQVGC